MFKSIAIFLYGLIKKLIFWLTRIPDEEVTAALIGEPLGLIAWPHGILTVRPTEQDSCDFERNVQPQLMKRTFRGMLAGLWILITRPYKVDVTNEQVNDVLNRTIYSRMISEDLKIDLRHHSELLPLPGFFVAGVLAHLEQDSNRRVTLTCLEVNGFLVKPNDPLWNLAKIFFVQALGHEAFVCDHTVIHQNNAFLECSIRKHLPTSNPLYWFLKSHFGFGLALIDALVRLFHKHTSPGNSLALQIDTVFKFAAGGNKYPRNSQMNSEFVDTLANTALQKAEEVVRDHVLDFFDQNVTTDAQFDKILSVLFDLRSRVPWIPNDLTRGCVVDVIARFIYEGSFLHSFNHIQLTYVVGRFGHIPRIRRPFDGVHDWKPHELFNRVDTFKRIVFMNVFSGEKHSESLLEVKYDERIRLTPGKFQHDLAALEREFPGIIKLDNTAAFVNI
ncbi:hypothetical protein BDR26DRAFT_920226 [Obelidium mucronatum]|nr:hypothetical protein BDR26DRAFT_920226 [Obelidium mucronatum]